MYEIPAPEYEVNTKTVNAEHVMAIDTYNGKIVFEVKRGTKWVTARDENGKLVFEKPIGEEVTVERKTQTQESREAQSRAHQNHALAKAIETRGSALEKALKEFSKDPSRYYALDSVLTAQAEKQIWDSMAHVAGLDDNADKDLVDVREILVETYKQKLLSKYSHRALSRSTSVTSNLYEDLEREAMANFVDGGTSFWY